MSARYGTRVIKPKTQRVGAERENSGCFVYLRSRLRFVYACFEGSSLRKFQGRVRWLPSYLHATEQPVEMVSTWMTTLLLLLCLFLGAGAEDATRAHAHKGIFRRLSPGSPQSAGLKQTAAARKRMLESTKPESIVLALPESPTSPKGTMRCSSIQVQLVALG